MLRVESKQEGVLHIFRTEGNGIRNQNAMVAVTGMKMAVAKNLSGRFHRTLSIFGLPLTKDGAEP